MNWSNPVYWAAAVCVLAVLLLHSWLSRRSTVWLGAVVPTVALVGLVYTGIVYGAGRTFTDYLGPALVIVLLLITWGNGYSARQSKDPASHDA